MTRQGLSVKSACLYSGLPRRSYYYAPAKGASQRTEPEISCLVRDVCNERPLYGYRRVTAVLRRQGFQINRKKVHRIMKENGLLHSAPPKRPHWQLQKGTQIAERPNTEWQADMTKVWCGADGWGYLFNVVDCCDRGWAGYSFSVFSGTAESELSVERALAGRAPESMRIRGLILRTDGGPQYTSRRFESFLSSAGIRHLVNRRHTPEDGGIVESFHKTLKAEYLWQHDFESFQQAEEVVRQAFFDYNENRVHSGLGYKTPSEYLREVMGKDLSLLAVKVVQK